jgi:hypothetical protein
MTQIRIRPVNPYDFSQEELDTLAEEIRQEDPTLEVEISDLPERGYGVTPTEIITIITAAGAVAAALGETAKATDAAVRWIRRRWQKDKQESDGTPRRRVIRILYGPNGEQLKSIAIDEPDGTPQEETTEAEQKRERNSDA